MPDKKPCSKGVKKVKSVLTIGVSVCAIVGAIATAWIHLGFPLPASAEDVRILTKGQAKLGIEVYKEREKELRREKRQLQWKTKDAIKNKASSEQIQMMEEQVEELQVEQQEATSTRKKYEQQYINAEK